MPCFYITSLVYFNLKHNNNIKTERKQAENNNDIDSYDLFPLPIYIVFKLGVDK